MAEKSTNHSDMNDEAEIFIEDGDDDGDYAPVEIDTSALARDLLGEEQRRPQPPSSSTISNMMQLRPFIILLNSMWYVFIGCEIASVHETKENALAMKQEWLKRHLT
jgi:hypothetical protein